MRSEPVRAGSWNRPVLNPVSVASPVEICYAREAMQQDVRALVDRVYAARRDDSPDEAHALATDALELARGAHDPELLVRALMAKGQCHRDEGDFEDAERLYVEAANLCRREEIDPLVVAHVIRHLGDVTAELGRFGLAKTHYEEALDLYRDIENLPPATLANAIRPLARLYDVLDEHAEAVEYWREALELYETAHVRSGIRECNRRLNGAA
ncbi:tetratricopeptide repeat protein [Henriciella mobilis]|uniref:Tetratricopeptide repeat protein n=2 Tax=Henriciella mobilis TaxID=2305467 RepID=A0A399RSY5_9PROT|nr:tetratricopeptide repeat protein [Henriciella mobilis]RIJ23059.1 tetratricopeptide repeat protein [Henriciella mobilis]RIJ32595.1 tetratricopeptide repeat protein [Henriciella mobilis]